MTKTIQRCHSAIGEKSPFDFLKRKTGASLNGYKMAKREYKMTEILFVAAE
jgi:hypothetical protein